jgi:transposase-like protein
MTSKERQMRRFSPAFKREKVGLIEQGKISVSELSQVYEVTRTAIYKWIDKYGHGKKGERMVVEKESEELKAREFLECIKQREQEIGRQQIEIRYLREVIRHWSDELGVDLEKKVERPL